MGMLERVFVDQVSLLTLELSFNKMLGLVLLHQSTLCLNRPYPSSFIPSFLPHRQSNYQIILAWEKPETTFTKPRISTRCTMLLGRKEIHQSHYTHQLTSISWIMFPAAVICSWLPVMLHILFGPPCSSSGRNWILAPDSCCIFLIISPPLPMMMPIMDRGTGTWTNANTNTCKPTLNIPAGNWSSWNCPISQSHVCCDEEVN